MTKEERKEYNRKYREANRAKIQQYQNEQRTSRKRGFTGDAHLFFRKTLKSLEMFQNDVRVGNMLGMNDNLNRQDELYTKAIESLKAIAELRKEILPYRSQL